MAPRDHLLALAGRAKNAPFIDLPLRYWPFARHRVQGVIQAFEAADLPGRRVLAAALTARALGHARQTAHGRGRSADLADWPILTKDAVRDRPDDFVLPGMMRIPAGTGGTTGIPLRLWRSAENVAAEQAFLDHVLPPHGRTMGGGRLAILRGDVIKPVADRTPPFGVHTHWGRRLVLSSPHLAPDTVGWYARTLQEFRPDVVVTYPNLALNLLQFLRARGLSLHLPLVMSSSETLTPEVRREIAQGFGAEVIDYYGQSERVSLAFARSADSFHFVPAYGRVELVLSPDDPVDELGRAVRIIGTGYWNGVMPLVRYETGDRAIVPAHADAALLEEISLGLAPFPGIAGRIEEYVLSPAGTRICALSTLPRELPGLLQIQIVQEALDALTIRVRAQPGFGEEGRGRLLANARLRIPPQMRIDLVEVDEVERTPQGKAPLVIRRLPPLLSGAVAASGAV
jgi:phenylacetate-CoA ligase